MAASLSDDFASFLIGGSFKKGSSGRRGSSVVTITRTTRGAKRSSRSTRGNIGRGYGHSRGRFTGRYGPRSMGSVEWYHRIQLGVLPKGGGGGGFGGGGGSGGGGFGGGSGGGSTRSVFVNARANIGGVAQATNALNYICRRTQTAPPPPELELGGLGARPPSGPSGTGSAEKLTPAIGDAKDFMTAVEQREGQDRQVSFMSIVISPNPEHGPVTSQQLAQMAEPWTMSHNGEAIPAVGYVHNDTNTTHLHLLVARSYYSQNEMQTDKIVTTSLAKQVQMDNRITMIPQQIQPTPTQAPSPSLDPIPKASRDLDRTPPPTGPSGGRDKGPSYEPSPDGDV